MNSPGFPVCKPGAYYVRSSAERELTCDKKSPISANDYLSPRRYALFGYLTVDKSFREIMVLCHTHCKCYQL
ncbi:hypothetical protein NUKP67_11680 [Klebsiella variicola]|nr:hypothetical protein NUKP67_11680 [Klebsiella variicola]